MDSAIQLNELLKLMVFHLIYIALILMATFALLPRLMWYRVMGMAAAAWVWSGAALLDFYYQDSGFLSWFLDPAAEKNLSAIMTSALLALIGLTALVVLWRSRGRKPVWQQAYWPLLAVLFLFLAADEYNSIHETFIYWRQAYLGLGGAVGLLTVIVLIFGDKSLRPFLLMFLIGLGSLGFAGVLIDAFSNQQVIDIGSFKLEFLHCRHTFLSVQCRDYGNSEEMMEMIGASVMWQSLLSIAWLWQSEQQRKTARRFLVALGGGWLFVMIGWVWIFPFVEGRVFGQSITVRYDDVTFTHYRISEATIQPGDQLTVTLYLQANHFLNEDYAFSVHLYTQPQAESVTQSDMLLGEFEYPTHAWIPGVPVRNRFHINVPEDIATGQSYQLVAMLWKDDAMQSIPANESDHPTLLNNQIIVLEDLPALSRQIVPSPDNAHYHFADGFSLTGYEIAQEAHPGDVVTARFWWDSETAVDTPLTQFIHAVNNATDELFVFDQIPFGGRFPTQDWPAGMHEVDSWQFALPAEMPPGTYRILSGMYQSYTIERSAITDHDGSTLPDNVIELGEMRILEAE